MHWLLVYENRANALHYTMQIALNDKFSRCSTVYGLGLVHLKLQICDELLSFMKICHLSVGTDVYKGNNNNIILYI